MRGRIVLTSACAEKSGQPRRLWAILVVPSDLTGPDIGRPRRPHHHHNGDHMDSYTYSLDGKSGVTMSSIQTALKALKIAEDADVRAHLPICRPTQRNTISALRTTLTPHWAQLKRGRAVLAEANTSGREFTCSVHISGEDEAGHSLSRERYSVTLQFDEEGLIIARDVRALLGDEGGLGCRAISSAIDDAEQSLSSTAWSDSWNSLHSSYGSLRATKMNYLVYTDEKRALTDTYVALAQAVGVRCYRHDQPQFAVAEALRDLISAQLEELNNRVSGDGKASSRLATSRLEAVAELGETLASLKGLLGGLATDMEASVAHLREQWSALQTAGSSRASRLTTKIALTPQGRDLLSLDPEAQLVLISKQGRDTLAQLQSLRDQLPAEGQQMVDTIAQVSATPLVFTPSLISQLKPLIEQGFVCPQTLRAGDLIDALRVLEERPQHVEDVSLENVPPLYRAVLTRTFSE